MKRGKKYIEAAKNIDRAAQYDTEEAISLVKKSAVAKFDETIECHIRTGCDGRHADQQIRGAVFKSFIFVSAICCKSAFEIVATVSLIEFPAPF